MTIWNWPYRKIRALSTTIIARFLGVKIVIIFKSGQKLSFRCDNCKIEVNDDTQLNNFNVGSCFNIRIMNINLHEVVCIYRSFW